MNKKALLQLLRYSSPNSLFIVDKNRQVKELRCPIMVIALDEVGGLKLGEKYAVQKVGLGNKLNILYLIESQYYYYYHFDILLSE